MRVIVTAGPTRQYIDTVRFITNASSGRMGCAVAQAAIEAGHDVTVLLAESLIQPLRRDPSTRTVAREARLVPFVTVEDLKGQLEQRFAGCDALVMAAAVGDFRVEHPAQAKLSRAGGPVNLRLVPTEDVVASVGARKRPGQLIIVFAVEDGAADQMESKARAEMLAKKADYVVVNGPSAMGAEAGCACVLSRAGVVVPWGKRPKIDLARQLVSLLEEAARSGGD